jgi:hypothetical protein
MPDSFVSIKIEKKILFQLIDVANIRTIRTVCIILAFYNGLVINGLV